MRVSVKQLKKETNQPAASAAITKENNIAGLPKKVLKAPGEKSIIKAITKDNITDRDTNLEKRKEMIAAKALEPAEFAYERSIGVNDSLYSNFTELIALTKRKVGRIVIKKDNKKIGYATGFMVSKELMLTNWHVFNNAGMTIESEVHFFYEYDAQGHPLTPVIFKLEPSKFFNNEELDYCLVAVQPFDVTNNVPLESIGYLFLDKALGKIGDVNVEKLNIIHHPQGDYKQISIRENLFVDINETKIFYQTDTAQGSSGSPVFNDQWQVVGLHHKSIAKMSTDGKNYLDKNGNIIPVTDGEIDVTKIVWLKNEGMRISVILKHLEKENPNNQLVAALSVPPPLEILSFAVNNSEVHPLDNNVAGNNSNNININIPVNALSAGTSVDISLSLKNIIPVISTTGGNDERNTTDTNTIFLEVAKADKEQAVDFSTCRGYDPDFLGIHVPLPKPKKALEKYIALQKNRRHELKYFKYSVIFNAVSKMPFISAINVEGDAHKRLDNSKREDDWLRDKRIDLECQLFDKFYVKSNFDKGHMSRFEDANWDNTEEDALRNGIYTCFYTNACPQVVALNRAGGLWGKLEKAVLEKGIKKEEGNLARMTVFNGPVFNEDKDKIFKGVTIPMQFYKIILWLNDEGKLKATAFKLSQELLVDNVKFDEMMRIDDFEALDIDKAVAFKAYQCSIKSLSRLTKIGFEPLEQYDTYNIDSGNDEVLIENEEALMLE
jgi:endonuclease G